MDVYGKWDTLDAWGSVFPLVQCSYKINEPSPFPSGCAHVIGKTFLRSNLPLAVRRADYTKIEPSCSVVQCCDGDKIPLIDNWVRISFPTKISMTWLQRYSWLFIQLVCSRAANFWPCGAMSLFNHLFCDSRESEVGRGGSRSMARRGDRGHNLSVWLELTCAPAKWFL